jgi:hypothetical protein
MNEEERLQRALEQQAGSLPQELLEKLPAEVADLLSLVSTLAEIRPPARDPQIAAAQNPKSARNWHNQRRRDPRRA